MSFGAVGPTLTLSVGTSSASLALPIGATHALLVNPSVVACTLHFAFGVGSATAVIPTAGGAGTMTYPVPPSGSLIVDIPTGVTFWAVIASVTGPTIASLTPGREA